MPTSLTSKKIAREQLNPRDTMSCSFLRVIFYSCKTQLQTHVLSCMLLCTDVFMSIATNTAKRAANTFCVAAVAAVVAPVPVPVQTEKEMDDEDLLAMASPFDLKQMMEIQQKEKERNEAKGLFRIFLSLPANISEEKKLSSKAEFQALIAKHKLTNFNFSSLYVEVVSPKTIRVTSAWTNATFTLNANEYTELYLTCLYPYRSAMGYIDQPQKSMDYLCKMLKSPLPH